MWILFLLIIPFLALLAVLVTVGVLVALAAQVAAHVFPLLLILAGAWLLIRAARGPGRRPQPPRPERTVIWPRPSGNREQAPRATAPARRTAPRRQLPPDVQATVREIRRKADLLLEHVDRFSPFSHDLYLVRQTTAEYLPRTISAYLAVPGLDDPVIGPSGKTALQELREQLQILDARLDGIMQGLQQRDLDQLLANRRFLEERFGRQDAEDGLPLQRTDDDRQRGPASGHSPSRASVNGDATGQLPSSAHR